MDGPKFLKDELKVKYKSKIYENTSLSLLPYGNVPPARVVGHEQLDDQRHLLCTSGAFYVFEKDHMLVKHFFESGANCGGYQYVRNFNANTVDSFPAHLFLMHDGNILIIRLQNSKINVVGCIDCTRKYRDNKMSLAASSEDGICFSIDSQRIYQWRYGLSYSEFDEIYNVQMGELLSFCFNEDNSLLLCICKSMLTEELYVEYASFSSHTGRFEATERYSLGMLDVANILIRQLNDHTLVCITVTEVWCIEFNEAPVHRLNKGLSKKIQLLNIDWDIPGDLVNLYASENIFTTSYSKFFSGRDTLKWSCRNIKKLLRLKSETVDFMYGIEMGIYLLLLRKSGIQIVNTSRKHVIKIPNCNYQNKMYFDGLSIFNNGTDLDMLLLCGAYDESSGFFERQSYQFGECQLISKKSFGHTPVMDMWLTRMGLFYESMGMVYNGNLVANFKDGIYVSKNGALIRDLNDDIIFTTSIACCHDVDSDCVLIIHEKGELEVATIDGNHIYTIILQLQLGEWARDASVISATYSSSEQKIYVVAYLDHYWLNFYCDNTLVSQTTVEPGFVLSALKIIDHLNRLLIIATSLDGMIRIYSALDRDILLEICSTFKMELHVVKINGALLFHNQQETILLELESLTYGNLSFPVAPVKIVPLDGCLVYVLDRNWDLNLVRIPLGNPPVRQSVTYNFPKCVPLKMVQFPATPLTMMVLKDHSHQKLQIILFDFVTMKILKTHEWTTDCFNIQLERLWDYVILYFYDGTSPIFHIFNRSLRLLQSDILPHPAMSMSVNFHSLQVKFSGFQTLVYDIVVEDNTLYLTANKCTTIHVNFDNTNDNIFHNNLVIGGGANDVSQDLTDAEVLADFMTPGGHHQTEIYHISTDYYNVQIGDVRYTLPHRILSIRSVPEGFQNVQFAPKRLTHTRPIFLITCSDSAIYLLTANAQNHEKKQLKN